MTEIIFLTSIGVLLLAHAYVAVRVGPRLSGRALWVVLLILGGTSLANFTKLLPLEGVQRTIAFFAVGVCIEDAIRTWFVVDRVRNNVRLGAACLAFAIALSALEIVIQLHGPIIAASYSAFGISLGEDAEFYGRFFSSYTGVFSTIAVDILRPIDHFFLCASMYYAWRMRSWVAYSGLIVAHIALNVIIDLILVGDPLNAPVPILGVSISFTTLLGIATLGLRNATRRHSAEAIRDNSGGA